MKLNIVFIFTDCLHFPQFSFTLDITSRGLKVSGGRREMKNIFGSNQDSQTLDGQPFVIRSVAKEQQDASEAHSKLFEQLEKKSSLPVWLTK